MPRPGRFISGKESRYTWYRRLGGPQKCGENILPPTGVRTSNRPTPSESLHRQHVALLKGKWKLNFETGDRINILNKILYCALNEFYILWFRAAGAV
jgi:hypothetical protein